MSTDPKVALKTALYAGHTLKVDPNLTIERIQQLDVNEPVAQEIWSSWRKSDANFDILMQGMHGRLDQYDDTYGPATEALTSLKRCPLPDNPIPDDLDLEKLGFEDPEIYELWKNIQAAPAGAQWPKSCITPTGHASKLDYSDRHAITIYLDTRQISTQWKNHLEEVCKKNVEIYAEIGLVVLYYIDGKPFNGLGPNLEPKQCEIHKIFENIRGGVIGWNEFPHGTCRVTISGRLDNSWNVSKDGHITLEWHETGHGVGEYHTRGGVMNPSIIFGLPYTWLNSPSFRSISSKYGGSRVSILPLGTSPPAPIPPSDTSPGNGVFFWEGRFFNFVVDDVKDLDTPNGVFNWQDKLLGIKIQSSSLES